MRRRLAPALLTVVALVSLTGCIKLDADIEVHEDETVSGTMTVGMSKQAMSMMQGMAESFGESLGEDGEGGNASLEGFDEEFFEADEIPEGAEVEPYEDDKFVGQTMTFSDITLDELTTSTADDEGEEMPWNLVKEGDTFVFEGTMDLADEEEASQAEEMGFEDMFAESEMEVSVTFPGRVTDSNGEVDGNTVTWRPEFGQDTQMRAEADASASFPVWPVVGGVAAVLLLGGLALVALRQRRSRAQDRPAGGSPTDGSPTDGSPTGGTPDGDGDTAVSHI
ncbi:LppM family (lipo)protein [Nocardioides solisilvae]|uniref:LppM family (lipo)protein n=1 Tax=Nocardioides solisilvae TaxID=1542435 RepID=UPI000D746043|nr:hypothetical protein [Nocardioides solisilvae]